MPPLCTPEKLEKDDNGSRRNRRKDLNSLKIDQLCADLPQLNQHFTLHDKVGEGTFSSVYLATLKSNPNKKFAVKHMVRTCHPNRIKTELECLKKLGGCDNVVGVDFCLRKGDNIVFVMPYLKHQNFNSYVGKMGPKELAFYMKNLLLAIARVHKFNIIHRDVKPSNFLYDRKNGKFLLVDFGLAQEVASKELKRKRDSNSSDDFPLAKRIIFDDEAIEVKQRNFSVLEQKENIPALQQGESIFAMKYKENFFALSHKENNSTQNSSRNKDFRAALSPVKLIQNNLNISLQNRNTNPRNLNKAQQNLNNNFENTKKIKNNLIIKQVITKTISETSSIKPKKNCSCYGKPRVCNSCVSLKQMFASRAGTPGFRPPEVLLKSTEQTTAVDIWACGVIMLNVLSNSNNFFVSPDDFIALAEIITVFGSETIRKVALQCGQHFITSENRKPLDLKKVCCVLRNREKIRGNFSSAVCCDCKQPDNICLCPGKSLGFDFERIFPDEAYDLLKKLLDVNPFTRISAKKALDHPFIKNFA